MIGTFIAAVAIIAGAFIAPIMTLGVFLITQGWTFTGIIVIILSLLSSPIEP
jgi:hypothetical protein